MDILVINVIERGETTVCTLIIDDIISLMVMMLYELYLVRDALKLNLMIYQFPDPFILHWCISAALTCTLIDTLLLPA